MPLILKIEPICMRKQQEAPVYEILNFNLNDFPLR